MSIVCLLFTLENDILLGMHENKCFDTKKLKGNTQEEQQSRVKLIFSEWISIRTIERTKVKKKKNNVNNGRTKVD